MLSIGPHLHEARSTIDLLTALFAQCQKVREVVQLLYRHAPQWCPVPVTLPAPSSRYRAGRAPHGPHATARPVPPSQPALELLDTPCSTDMLHVVSTGTFAQAVPVEVFQCLLGTTLTAQLKALGALR